MQKTYWWRAMLTVFSLAVLGGLFVSLCDFKFGKCIGGDSILIARTFFHVFLSVLIVSPFLFLFM